MRRNTRVLVTIGCGAAATASGMLLSAFEEPVGSGLGQLTALATASKWQSAVGELASTLLLGGFGIIGLALHGWIAGSRDTP